MCRSVVQHLPPSSQDSHAESLLTLFSVLYGVYAVIFNMVETPIVNNVRFILLYKLFIDDLVLIWTGPAAVLC